MTPSDQVLAEVRRDRRAQGLPERLEDPDGVSAAAAVLLATHRGRAVLTGPEVRTARRGRDAA